MNTVPSLLIGNQRQVPSNRSCLSGRLAELGADALQHVAISMVSMRKFC